jgi:hypothetical protein
MIAFTILGLLVFWFWCFHIGYALGYLATVSDVLLRLLWIEWKLERGMRAMSASQQQKAGEPA